MASRRELLRDQIVTAFQGISTTSGYNTTPANVFRFHPLSVEEFPCIVVEMGDEDIKYLDMPRTISNSDVTITVWGYYRDDVTREDENVYAAESAGEPLLADMRKVLDSLMTVNINNADNKWNVTLEKSIRVRGPAYYQQTQGRFSLQFTAKIRFQTS